LLTFAEKIISVKADGGRKVHHAGEIAVLPPDMGMAQDSTGPLAIKVFREIVSRMSGATGKSPLRMIRESPFRLCPESPDLLRNSARQ